MSRIEKKFQELQQKGRKALITFVTAGDPDAQKSVEILNALPDAGADLIELGMPFSDPMADGPTIQAASQRALESGATLKDTLKMLQQFRSKNNSTPVILMGYYNPIYAYGTDNFVRDAAAAGADGLIIVDLPPEEDEELRVPAEKAGLNFIKLVSPTTDDARLDKILSSASGFLYYVSITGVTGTKSANVAEVGDHIAQIKKKTDLPVAVGFGIKTPDDAKEMAAIADAVVVGSAIVDTVKDYQKEGNLSEIISKQVSALKKALEN